MSLSRLKQLIKFNREAFAKGWFAQWLETGDVISKCDRDRIKRQVSNEYVTSLSAALLDEEPSNEE